MEAELTGCGEPLFYDDDDWVCGTPCREGQAALFCDKCDPVDGIRYVSMEEAQGGIEFPFNDELAGCPCHPPSPFGDFLLHMAETGAGEWVWPVLDICARYGVFCADERRCMVARPVDTRIPLDVLNNFGDLEGDYLLTMEPDAWHIVYASGDIRSFFDLAPYELPKLIWQRNGEGEARIYDYKRTRTKVMASQPKIKAQPKPDPTTLASTADGLASREAELERKRRGMWYSGFVKRPGSAMGSSAFGGEQQPLG